MHRNMRFIVAGVALGAVLGAIVGLLYNRAAPAETPSDGERAPAALDLPQIARLGLLVLGTVKQILALT